MPIIYQTQLRIVENTFEFICAVYVRIYNLESYLILTKGRCFIVSTILLIIWIENSILIQVSLFHKMLTCHNY